MEWFDKTFNELTTMELFKIYYLRCQVFNGEQESTYPDPDMQDLTAHHVFAMQDDQIAAYARYFEINDGVTFGRVVTAPEYRGKGLGKQLIRKVLQQIQATFPNKQITIHAQQYVERFYRELGFKSVGGPFVEAERQHIKMIYKEE